MNLELAYTDERELNEFRKKVRHYRTAKTLGQVPVLEIEPIKEYAERLELEILLHWEELTSRRTTETSNDLKLLSKDLLDVLSILADTSQDSLKLPDFIKLLTFSYVSEHGERTRRLATKLAQTINTDYPEEWSKRVLVKTYHTLIYLTRKDGWADLERVIELVNSLRHEQAEYESASFTEADNTQSNAVKAYEMAALYHLIKAIETCAQFQLNGTPNNAEEEIEIQLEYALGYCNKSGLVELNFTLRLIKATFSKMVGNSIWMVGKRINSNVTKFLNSMRQAEKPVMELLYPQKDAILNQGLLNPAHRAIVVNLPTSSGKTLVAEFKILQALNQFQDQKGWIAYVVPTRALVNQITRRLKEELGKDPLNLKVASMSGALEVDGYEELMVERGDFDVLVATPEKMNLLIRRGIETRLGRPLALAVIDEAHNLSDPTRGINLELLLSNIKQDCANANLLLLTPFVPNSNEIAEWLDPESPSSISLALSWWKPNDQIIGTVQLADQLVDHKLSTEFMPLMTSNAGIEHDHMYTLGATEVAGGRSRHTAKYKVAALAGLQYKSNSQQLVVAKTIPDTYSMAEVIKSHEQPLEELDSDLAIVKRYVADELGQNFPLVHLLDYGIGLHHSALPEEIKVLMEIMMEQSKLRYLVATTTIAQGINFNTPSIFMASYEYPYGNKMPHSDFWNLVGRSGRVNQDSVGVVGISSSNENDTANIRNYLSAAAEEIVSTLKKMVEDITDLGGELDLEKLYYKAEWSNFLQYIAHMYNQSQNLSTFEAEVYRTMKRTLGYGQLPRATQEKLIESVKKYARKLDSNKELSTLSDMTGFSPETIGRTIAKAHHERLTAGDWSASVLFQPDSSSLKKLVNIMLSAPEVRKDLNELMGNSFNLSETKIANMVTDWVSGAKVQQIADKYFSQLGSSKQLTECVRSIHKYLVGSTTWGMSAIQRIPNSGIDFESLSEMQKLKIYDLPAMIYYGVDTSEAIALRRNKLTRTSSKALATKLGADFSQDVHTIPDSSIQTWVQNLSARDWELTSNRGLSGNDNKRVWELLNG